VDAEKVHGRLEGHYPARVITWVRSARWKRATVPLDRIEIRHRPGRPHDAAKVAAIRRSIRNGKKLKPVVLVHTGRGRLKVADGYHRTRALQREGRTHVDAYVGRIRRRSGPWSRSMHDAKLNT
jgi:hypothetical protein